MSKRSNHVERPLERGYWSRTVLEVISAEQPGWDGKRYVCVKDGKVWVGEESHHLSPRGRQYAKLMRLRPRG